jgi:hypothetical protein
LLKVTVCSARFTCCGQIGIQKIVRFVGGSGPSDFSVKFGLAAILSIFLVAAIDPFADDFSRS